MLPHLRTIMPNALPFRRNVMVHKSSFRFAGASLGRSLSSANSSVKAIAVIATTALTVTMQHIQTESQNCANSISKVSVRRVWLVPFSMANTPAKTSSKATAIARIASTLTCR